MTQQMFKNKQAEEKATGGKHLVIGLDFGTAFSKVVIGDNRVRYAVPFATFAHPDNHYLLPSILAIDENNICGLSSAELSADNLKLPLLDNSYTDDDLLRVSAYLALVLRASKNWLLDRYQKRYGHKQISWSVNAGLPADSSNYHELSVLYKKLIHTAWVISALPGPVTLNRVSQYMDVKESAFDAFPAVYRSKIISKDKINTFPGCTAQICGYVHSKKCSDDLHLLLDIGAGSINIATFNTGSNNGNRTDNSSDDRNSEKKCALYACAVGTIGVDYLLKRRYENLKLSDKDINLFKDIPDTSAFSQAYDLTEKDIMFADTLYSGDVARLINTILDVTKEKHHSNSNRWESGVLTFGCGGGAHMEIIQNVLNSFKNKKPPHKVQAITLSLPEDLMVDDLPESAFDRISVAYGLSFDADEIGKAVNKDSTDDIEQATEA